MRDSDKSTLYNVCVCGVCCVCGGCVCVTTDWHTHTHSHTHSRTGVETKTNVECVWNESDRCSDCWMLTYTENIYSQFRVGIETTNCLKWKWSLPWLAWMPVANPRFVRSSSARCVLITLTLTLTLTHACILSLCAAHNHTRTHTHTHTHYIGWICHCLAYVRS